MPGPLQKPVDLWSSRIVSDFNRDGTAKKKNEEESCPSASSSSSSSRSPGSVAEMQCYRSVLSVPWCGAQSASSACTSSVTMCKDGVLMRSDGTTLRSVVRSGGISGGRGGAAVSTNEHAVGGAQPPPGSLGTLGAGSGRLEAMPPGSGRMERAQKKQQQQQQQQQQQ